MSARAIRLQVVASAAALTATRHHTAQPNARVLRGRCTSMSMFVFTWAVLFYFVVRSGESASR